MRGTQQHRPRRAGRRPWPASLLCALALATACARGPNAATTPPAPPAVAALAEALRSDDPAPAYALLSQQVRSQIAFETFAARWRETAAERRARADELEAGALTGAGLHERARLALPGGGTAWLVREGEGWRMESPMLSSAHAKSPQDAARLLAQALAGHDLDGILEVLTERRREAVASRLEALVASLTEQLDRGTVTVEQLGDERAVLRWDSPDEDGEGTRYELFLHLEQEQWRVDDVRIREAER